MQLLKWKIPLFVSLSLLVITGAVFYVIVFRGQRGEPGRVAVNAVNAVNTTPNDSAATVKNLWRQNRLEQPPATYPAVGFQAEGAGGAEGVNAIFLEGLPYKGRKTRIFAWYGVPRPGGSNVPAMVLVHGAGGTAFAQWVDPSWTNDPPLSGSYPHLSLSKVIEAFGH